jgi:hypothetical protein
MGKFIGIVMLLGAAIDFTIGYTILISSRLIKQLTLTLLGSGTLRICLQSLNGTSLSVLVAELLLRW